MQQHEIQDMTEIYDISRLKTEILLMDCYFSDFGFFIMA
jgi:hypothetical protein